MGSHATKLENTETEAIPSNTIHRVDSKTNEEEQSILIDSTQVDILISGYCNKIGEKIDWIIPDIIHEIIKLYFSSKYKIYGIGRNENNEFGIDTTNFIATEWRQLKQLETTIGYGDIDNIFYHSQRIFVINDDKVYISGSNNNMGFIKIDNIPNNQSVQVISNGFPHEQNTFFYTLNHHLYRYEESKGFTKCNVNFMSTIIDIASGLNHTLFLCQTGQIYAFGKNNAGQCGQEGNLTYLYRPKLVEFDDDELRITKIAVGYEQNLMLNEYNELYVFGNNDEGQLGLLTRRNLFVYKPIINHYINGRIKHIDCGARHSLCITMKGDCFTFGNNDFGQIGNGKYSSVSVPSKVIINIVQKPKDEEIENIDISEEEEGYTENIDINEHMMELERDYIHKKIEDHHKHDIIDGGCGHSHCLLLTKSNLILSFGNNKYKQCASWIDRKTIPKPHLVSKSIELGISPSLHVERVIAFMYESIVVIGANQKIHV